MSLSFPHHAEVKVARSVARQIPARPCRNHHNCGLSRQSWTEYEYL